MPPESSTNRPTQDRGVTPLTPIEARGEVMGGGKSITFVRGVITSDGRPVLNFSGTIKKRSKRVDSK